ncbi:hypothetical protein PH552_27730 [Rhizobium sp. CNPSo 3968]|uniref:hypothetical protein n=1 Tax=Rhizobium sp. CNPSo 3968 TaxID=3021408 RepID=UPI0013AF8E70|nr:hypothetical protein [Rhizobium sp. CNPSo 3968]MDK4723150.1 hypothetical protein [Rhizobium sp. CNPSo 3968]
MKPDEIIASYPADWRYSEIRPDGQESSDFRPFDPPDFSRFPTSKLSDRTFFRRLLLSLRDLSHAASAATFIHEDIDFSKTYGRADLRRFMCYETTLVVSYARPFSEARRGLPPLSYKRMGISLPGSTQRLHDDLMSKRNKIFAHADPDGVPHSRPSAMKGRRSITGEEFSVLTPPQFLEGTLLDALEFAQVDLLIRYLSDVVYRLANEMHTYFPGEYQEFDLEGSD